MQTWHILQKFSKRLVTKRSIKILLLKIFFDISKQLIFYE